ncbi:MAG TPA: DsbA family protein [Kofleriaceae bacterium]|jgi:protein-disulfide isomerase
MTTASRLALLAFLALVGCAHPQPPAARPAASPSAGPAAPAGAAPAPAPAPAPGSLKIDRSGTIEQQLARLQDAHDRNAEATEFLNTVYAQQKAKAAAHQADESADEPADDAMFAVDIAGEIKAGQVDGPAGAAVTIVKAFDFACPYCQRMAAPMKQLVQEYNGKVRVVYANLVVHAPARPAHLASCAAAKQGKYMQFKDAFWDKGFAPYAASGGRDPASLGEDNLVAIARGLGLDIARFKTDMASRECADRIASDAAEMEKWHVNATPTFFINGKPLSGAMAKDELKKLIDEELKKVESSGVPAAQYYDKVVLARGEKQFRSKVDARPH